MNVTDFNGDTFRLSDLKPPTPALPVSATIMTRLLPIFLLLGICPIAVAQPSPSSPPAEESATETTLDVDALFELGRTLFEDYAPEEIKEQFRFPTREEFDTFFTQLQQALQTGSLEDLAAYKPQAEAALLALRAFPDYAPYADWLRERLDYIDAAESVVHQPPTRAPAPSPSPTPSAPSPPRATPRRPQPSEPVPHYDLWVQRLRDRPAPAAAARYVTTLRPAFDRAEVPTALVWLAEIESSFNPDARSPVGARGLYQFMPATATDLGLRLRPFDERADPRKSADAAARYLQQLHARFDSWPLALAAYNAGPGRVGRLLQKRNATTYAQIADALPSETRMYVPKVLATLALRTGQSL